MTINLTNGPLVTIIVPVYKTEKYLTNCLMSIINQSYGNLEVILVDDGSPDNAYLIAENFCKKDPRFSLIRQKNNGLSGARNTGILHANGKYLLFLDSDDTLISYAVSDLVEIAEKDDTDMVIPDRYYKIIEGSSKKTIKFHFTDRDYNSNPLEFGLKVLVDKGRAWRATSVLYKRKIINSFKLLFPIDYTGEDIVFNLLFLSNASKISFCQKPTLINLQRQGSITNSYNRKLMKMFLFIDNQVDLFIKANNIDNKTSQNCRDALLLRNLIIELTNIMSPENKISFIQKVRLSISTLQMMRIQEVLLKKQYAHPYFNSKKIQVYFQIMEFLLFNRIYFLAFVLAYIVSNHIKNN